MSDIEVTVLGRSYTFTPQTLITIGRSKDAVVSIDDKTVSRQHGDLRFETNVNGWVYTDLASGNGSYINGMAIMNTQLSLPTEIKLGEQDDAITIRITEKVTAPAPTPEPIPVVIPEPIAEPIYQPVVASPAALGACTKCQGPTNATFGPRCPACDTLIHRNCWEFNNGCTNPACSAKGTN